MASIGCDSPAEDSEATMGNKVAQPRAKTVSVSETHWGVEIADPYRYMENLGDPEVEQWFRAQAAYTDDYLSRLESRAALFERLEALDQGAPFTTGGVERLADGTVFFLRRNSGENLYKLYVRPAGEVEARLLIDPEAMGTDSEQHYSLEGYTPSPSGRFVVYGLAQGGSGGNHLPRARCQERVSG